MIPRQIKTILLLITCTLSFVSKGHSQASPHEHEAMVVMRMIGHKVLLVNGDSSSLVMPILKEEGRYKIGFETNFQLDPFDCATIVDTIMRETKLSNEYRVEVEHCENSEVVHSFQLSDTIQPYQIACRGRILPTGCYQIFITLLDAKEQTTASVATISSTNKLIQEKSQTNYLAIVLFIIITGLIGFIIYIRKKRSHTPTNLDIISIGNYQFDKKNMLLLHESNSTQLTSKEADLLFLLHESANTVISRENILNVVWGDEGDYIGRTLDVFISKLRKKLSFDESLKIVTIHGVGYKFVINN